MTLIKTNGAPKAPLTEPVPTQAILHAELDELVELIEFRPGVLNEALIQRNAILDYFRGVLNFTQGSHPATFDLAYIALRVGQFVAMHYKHKFSIPRPSYLAPALMPPIDPPGHASWPSGHATEAHLIARCLEAVLPPAAHDTGAPGGNALDRMAERITRNREVLGMHYPTDGRAGRQLAQAALPLLMQCPSLAGSTGLVALAISEW